MHIVTCPPTRRKQTRFPKPIGDRPRFQDTGEIVEVYGNPGARYLPICLYIAKRNLPAVRERFGAEKSQLAPTGLAKFCQAIYDQTHEHDEHFPARFAEELR